MLNLSKQNKINTIKRKLSNEKGAMDKILVTLLLVIVGVGAVVGLTTWIQGETDKVQTGASTQISNVLNDANSN